jgi:hypothetical protein
MTEREAQRRAKQREQAPLPSEQRALSIPDKTASGLRRRKTPAAVAAGWERRWRRKALADYWGVSERTVDRMRADGRLGEPVGYVGAGRLPIWSDEQRLAAEQP